MCGRKRPDSRAFSAQRGSLGASRCSAASESGMVTVSYVMATGLSLLVITWCMLFVVTAYTRAVVRDAASRASRDGVADYNLNRNTLTALNACKNRFTTDLSSGLPASTRSGLSGDCSIVNGKVVVRTTGSLKNIGGIFLPFQIDETTRRNIERGS